MLGNTCPLFYFHFLPFSQRPFATRFSYSGFRNFVNFIFERGNRETSVKFIRFEYRLLRYILLFLNISILQIFIYRVFRSPQTVEYLTNDWTYQKNILTFGSMGGPSYATNYCLADLALGEILRSIYCLNRIIHFLIVDLSRHSLSNIINLFKSIL